MAKKQTSTSDSSESSTIDFETSLGEIEKIVRALENGELSLSESLQEYESAVAKMRQCYELLEVAERKIGVLAGFDAEGNPVIAPMDEDAADGTGSDVLIKKQRNRGRRRGVGGPEQADETFEEETL